MAKRDDRKQRSDVRAEGKSKLTKDEKEELKAEGELPKKVVRKREEGQLTWFFVIVAILFAAFLVPYFTLEGAKTFEYGGVDWVAEEYAEPTGVIYHGRFEPRIIPDLIFNVYLRVDPRENDVRTEGTFSKFRHGGVVSISPEVDACRGELSRVMLDLRSFLEQGIGVGSVESGSTSFIVANQSNRRYAVCDSIHDRTIVIVDIGEPAVIQHDMNPYCYTIYAENCNDVSSVEKFIVKSIIDFAEAA